MSGRAIALIDDAEYEVDAGDFIGFPAPSVAHLMRNPGPDDLVYLCGGENREFEVADFPKLGKRMVRMGKQVDIYDVERRSAVRPDHALISRATSVTTPNRARSTSPLASRVVTRPRLSAMSQRNRKTRPR